MKYIIEEPQTNDNEWKPGDILVRDGLAVIYQRRNGSDWFLGYDFEENASLNFHNGGFHKLKGKLILENE